MNIPARPLFGSVIALSLALLWPAMAQEPAAPATPVAQSPAASAPAATPTPPASEAPAVAPAQPAPATDHTPPAASTDNAPLRRLDVPAAPTDSKPSETVAAPLNSAPADTAATPPPAVSAEKEAAHSEAPPAVPVPPVPVQEGKHHSHVAEGKHGDERVSFFHNSTLPPGETAQAVVSIFGSSRSEGTVHDAVVSVFGSSTSSGDVGNAVVSVFGSSRVTGGSVGDSVVSVFGTTRVNARVHGEVVAVFGNVELGPDAEIDGHISCVGGSVKRDPHAIVHGQVNNVAFGPSFDGADGAFVGFHAWINQCLFLGRPLAFGADLLWAWWIAFALLGFYALLALIFPRRIEKCMTTLDERPGFSILAALLTVLLTPIVIVLLCVTVVGIPVVPFLVAALFFSSLFGKAVMLTWLGRCITKHLGDQVGRHVAVATLVGGGIMLLLYTVPVLGFILYKATGLLGLGVVVYTLILGTRKKPKIASAGSVPPFSGVDPLSDVNRGIDPTGYATAGAGVPPVMPPPVVMSAVALPRAGFWIRLAASLIDAFLVGVAIHLLPHHWAPSFLFSYAVYCVVLWGLKGTTVGGIVCNLKVVRLDDRPMDWPTALVRGLGGFLSLVAAGLGFIWVAFDDQRQSWHDKIAGTTVVQVPRGVSLV
jgi:uncharacterized RDD family membrane protein YckC